MAKKQQNEKGKTQKKGRTKKTKKPKKREKEKPKEMDKNEKKRKVKSVDDSCAPVLWRIEGAHGIRDRWRQDPLTLQADQRTHHSRGGNEWGGAHPGRRGGGNVIL